MLPPLFVILVICLLCFLIGTTELAVGIVEFTYFDMIPKPFVYVGSFWAGCFPILGAFMVFIGMRKQYHKALIAGWVFALIAACLAIAGTVLDGLASVKFASLTACAQVASSLLTPRYHLLTSTLFLVLLVHRSTLHSLLTFTTIMQFSLFSFTMPESS